MARSSRKKKLLPLSLRHKAEEASADFPVLKAVAEKAAFSLLSGGHAQRKPGTGEKFWQFREYNDRDRPQDIDWRQSAKGDRVFIRQKEWQTTQTSLFWVQNDAAMAYSSHRKYPPKNESAVILATALAILMIRGHEHIGSLDGSVRPGRTDIVLEKLGRYLINNKTEMFPQDDLTQIPRNSSLVLCGDFLSPIDRLEETCVALASRSANLLLLQILDPAELSLPFAGRIIFDDEANDRYHIQNVQSVRVLYRERINKHLEDLQSLCKRHQWHWILHRTDKEIRDTLFTIWAAMSHEK